QKTGLKADLRRSVRPHFEWRNRVDGRDWMMPNSGYEISFRGFE
ncbi:hypothetical protein NPIL_541881, partial [Nephila pilipes]